MQTWSCDVSLIDQLIRLSSVQLRKVFLPNRQHHPMSRKFFVGGNFKLNPITQDAKSSLIGGLNKADLDPETGEALLMHPQPLVPFF
jgi:hypothetical protein